MAYVRKTYDEYVIQRFDDRYGWEDETSEASYREAREQLRCYRENAPARYRIKVRRVRIEQEAPT